MKSKYSLIFILSISLLYSKEILTVSEAYQLGLSHANEIKSSFYQYKANEERIKQQESNLYPHLSVSSNINRGYNELRRESAYQNADLSESTDSISVSFTQVVYDPSINIRTDIEKKQTELSFLNHSILKQNFATEVLESYLKILKSRNRIAVLESYVDYYSSFKKLIEEKLKLNLVSKMDLLDIEVNLEQSKLQVTKERELLKAYKKNLSYLIGIDSKEITLPQNEIKYISENKIQEMLSVVQNFTQISNSLQYVKAEKGIELMEKKIEEAKSSHLPKVNFQANYKKNFSDSPTTYYDNTKILSLHISMPIYQGGMVKAQIEEAKLNRLAALEDSKKIEKKIDIDYKQELSNFEYLVKAVELYRKAYEKSELYLKLANEGYKSGLKSIVDIYDAQAKLNDNKFKYMQNVYDMFTSYINLLIITNNMKELVLVDKILTRG